MSAKEEAEYLVFCGYLALWVVAGCLLMMLAQ